MILIFQSRVIQILIYVIQFILLITMEKVPKCISNSSATLICMNETCNQPNPFICGANHDCKQQHKTCVKLQWITFKEKLDENRQTVNPIFKLLSDKLDKVITKAIQQLLIELDNFNKWKKQYGDIERIAEFYQCIQLNREIRWCGKDICQLKNDIRTKFDSVKIDNKKIENFVIEIEQKRQEYMKMIRELYEGQKEQISNNIIKIKSYELSELNKKLKQIKQEPKYLELKFVENKLFRVLFVNHTAVNNNHNDNRALIICVIIVYE